MQGDTAVRHANGAYSFRGGRGWDGEDGDRLGDRLPLMLIPAVCCLCCLLPLLSAASADAPKLPVTALNPSPTHVRQADPMR